MRKMLVDEVSGAVINVIEIAEGAPYVAPFGTRLADYVYVPDVVSVAVADIKTEAQRRIIMLMGATSLEHCIIKQLNANMRANELNAIHYERAWTVEEAAEANALKAMAAAVKTVRARSNQIEAMDPVPLDFTADAYWQ